MGGIGLGIGCFEKLQSLVSSSRSSDPYRSKVAEEMLHGGHGSVTDMHKPP
jgi:hypothetical protein